MDKFQKEGDFLAEYSIIADISRYLLERVRSLICPRLLPNREQVALSAPYEKNNEALLQLYLYDIQDFAEFTARSPGKPPAGILLRYLLCFSRYAQAPLDPQLQQMIFGRLIQDIHRVPALPLREFHPYAGEDESPLPLALSKLDPCQKRGLWSSLSEPLRPAVYLEAGPVLLSGEREEVHRAEELVFRLQQY